MFNNTLFIVRRWEIVKMVYSYHEYNNIGYHSWDSKRYNLNITIPSTNALDRIRCEVIDMAKNFDNNFKLK